MAAKKPTRRKGPKLQDVLAGQMTEKERIALQKELGLPTTTQGRAMLPVFETTDTGVAGNLPAMAGPGVPVTGGPNLNEYMNPRAMNLPTGANIRGLADRLAAVPEPLPTWTGNNALWTQAQRALPPASAIPMGPAPSPMPSRTTYTPPPQAPPGDLNGRIGPTDVSAVPQGRPTGLPAPEPLPTFTGNNALWRQGNMALMPGPPETLESRLAAYTAQGGVSPNVFPSGPSGLQNAILNAGGRSPQPEYTPTSAFRKIPAGVDEAGNVLYQTIEGKKVTSPNLLGKAIEPYAPTVNTEPLPGFVGQPPAAKPNYGPISTGAEPVYGPQLSDLLAAEPAGFFGRNLPTSTNALKSAFPGTAEEIAKRWKPIPAVEEGAGLLGKMAPAKAIGGNLLGAAMRGGLTALPAGMIRNAVVDQSNGMNPLESFAEGSTVLAPLGAAIGGLPGAAVAGLGGGLAELATNFLGSHNLLGFNQDDANKTLGSVIGKLTPGPLGAIAGMFGLGGEQPQDQPAQTNPMLALYGSNADDAAQRMTLYQNLVSNGMLSSGAAFQIAFKGTPIMAQLQQQAGGIQDPVATAALMRGIASPYINHMRDTAGLVQDEGLRTRLNTMADLAGEQLAYEPVLANADRLNKYLNGDNNVPGAVAAYSPLSLGG